MKVDEQLLMSYLIDLNNLAVDLAQLSQSEANSHKHTLRAISVSADLVQTRLGELSLSNEETYQNGLVSVNT